MRDTYSLYEAKAQLSAIIARVREGETVAISHRGVPVAEIRPISPPAETIEERLDRMVARGEAILPPPGARADYTPGPRRPGGLAQFLADRD